MKQRIILALMVVSIMSFARLGQARPLGRNQVPFGAILEGPLPDELQTSTGAAVYSVEDNGSGESALLGPFQWVGRFTERPDPNDSRQRIITDGIGVMTATNGDALFFAYRGRVYVGRHEVDEGDARVLEFVITGGQGRFLGATGSGRFRDGVGYFLPGFTREVEGTLSVLDDK